MEKELRLKQESGNRNISDRVKPRLYRIFSALGIQNRYKGGFEPFSPFWLRAKKYRKPLILLGLRSKLLTRIELVTSTLPTPGNGIFNMVYRARNGLKSTFLVPAPFHILSQHSSPFKEIVRQMLGMNTVVILIIRYREEKLNHH